ncbi:MAG: DnaA/Hda family protein [Pirellulales bacterium]|nr:DnaA/Hda family protein [Pirellulales bacterium]
MDGSDRLSILREALVARLGPQRYELWVGPHASIKYVDEKLCIGCPTEFEMKWLRSRLHDALRDAAMDVWQRDVTIEYHVLTKSAQSTGSEPERAKATSTKTTAAESTVTKTATGKSGAVAAANTENTAPRLDSDSDAASGSGNEGSTPRGRGSKSTVATGATFANYVVGPGNDLACRTAQSVARWLGHYGPLCLFGPPGVGKTHLVYAMLHHWKHAPARVRAIRLTAEQFTSEFLEGLHHRALPGFRQKYRSVDALVIDDIQFLVGKRATLDELLYTIDTLHERGRQIVLTCDRSPGDLQHQSSDLVSRISGGLAVPLELPSYATRLGITRRFAAQMGLPADEEIMTLIATQVAGSARQICGAINLLVATSQAQGTPMTADLTRATLMEYVQQNTPTVRLADIQRAVCQVFGVEPGSLKSKRKTRSLAEPRMLAMWLSRKYTRAALGEIGAYFGRSSHSTVISAHKRIEGLVSRGANLHVADRPCHVEEAIRQVEAVMRSA